MATNSSGLRVLVVEDHRLNRIAAARLLELRGFAVATAADGKEAVERITREERFDVVFMDCEMPVLDGFAATEEIRRREAAAAAGDGGLRLPIVGLSAHDREDARARCIASGMDDYLVKPLRSDSIDAVIARWVHNPGGGTPDAAQATPDPGLDLIDINIITRLRGEVPADLLLDLIGELATDAATRAATMAEAAAGRDLDLLRAEAHSLKGAALNLGAAGLGRACADVEAAAKAGRVPLPAVNALTSLADRSVAALKTALAGS